MLFEATELVVMCYTSIWELSREEAGMMGGCSVQPLDPK